MRTFTPQDRLKKRAEFLAVFKAGRRMTSGGLQFVFLRNGQERSRVGLDVSRKVGKACRRNTIKRRLREVFRNHRGLLAGNYDVVIRVIPGSGELYSYRNIEQAFRKFAEKTAG